MTMLLFFCALGLVGGLYGVQIYNSSPGKPTCLQIRNTYTVYFANGLKRLIENVFQYGPAPGVCGGPAWGSSQKAGLVTYATGITSAGVPNVPSGITTLYGFEKTVLNNSGGGLNTLLSNGALSAGIFARWIDQVTDADIQVGDYAPTLPQTSASTGNGVASGGGVAGDRLPLDNHVTVRKYTGVRGKEWSRGRWKFAPIAESQTTTDELTSGAQTLWSALKVLLYCPITDGTTTGGVANCLFPILISTKLSQLMRAPTRVVYANLVLPGVNYITGQTNTIINATLGEQRRRKEKPDVVF